MRAWSRRSRTRCGTASSIRFNERTASPNELARELGEPLGRVSYHVRTLADIGAIELVGTEPRRGAVEHFYRAAVRPWFGDDDWAKLPASARRELFGQILQRVMSDVSAAAGSGGFDHLKAYVSLVTLDLDEQGMGEVSDLLDETLQRALEIQAACRRARPGADHRAGHAALRGAAGGPSSYSSRPRRIAVGDRGGALGDVELGVEVRRGGS